MLLWMDGFDTYGADEDDVDSVIAGAGYTRAENLSMESSTRTGRGMAVEMASGAVSSQVGRIRRAIGTVNEVIVGFAVKVEGNNFFTVLNLIYDNLLGTATTHLGVARNAQAGVSVYTYSGSTRVLIGASEPNCFFANVWHYIEVKYKPGSYTVVRIDGATVLSTGGNHNAAAPQLVNMVQLTNPDFSTRRLEAVGGRLLHLRHQRGDLQQFLRRRRGARADAVRRCHAEPDGVLRRRSRPLHGGR